MLENDYDLYGFDVAGYNRYTGTKYDSFGYDINGYSKDGYDRYSYDRDGYDRIGYDKDGYSKDGYDKDNYDRDGYDKNGWNRNGWNKVEIYNQLTQSLYDSEGYCKDGYNKDNYNRDSYDRNGYDRNGYKKDGYNSDGYDIKGYDRYSYDKDGYKSSGYNKKGFHRDDYEGNGLLKNCIVRSEISKSVDKITYEFDEEKVTTYNKNGYVVSHWGVPYSQFSVYVKTPTHYGFRKKYFGNLKSSKSLNLYKKDEQGNYIIPNHVIRPVINTSKMSIWHSAGLSYAILFALGARSSKLSIYSFAEIKKILDHFNHINGSSLPDLSKLYNHTISNLEKRLTEYDIRSAASEAASYSGGRLNSYAQIYDAVWIKQISPDLCELLS